MYFSFIILKNQFRVGFGWNSPIRGIRMQSLLSTNVSFIEIEIGLLIILISYIMGWGIYHVWGLWLIWCFLCGDFTCYCDHFVNMRFLKFVVLCTCNNISYLGNLILEVSYERIILVKYNTWDELWTYHACEMKCLG